jgi:hypothetical protein
VKVLAYLLTAATILIGADVFVMSPDEASQPTETATVEEEGRFSISMHGGTGMPTPPPD